MKRESSGIETVGKSDFVDAGEAKIVEQVIASGRGRVESESAASKPLEPEIVCAEDGRLGWRVRMPRRLPLATPSIVGETVFLGGGFGSHEFYALDAGSGAVRWQLRTGDDGPTAAVVSGGYVAFNTESCTVYVVDARTGRVRWQEWLGDPLMAQPAVDGSTVYMAFPDRQRKHQLAAFDLATGKRRWGTEIIADVMSAPILADGAVYASTLDGTVYRIDRESGKAVWSLPQRATSAPWIHRGKIFVSQREDSPGGDSEGNRAGGRSAVFEGHATMMVNNALGGFSKAFTQRRAEYLRESASPRARAFHAQQDAGVGFSSSPLAAKIPLSSKHLGLGSVSALWAFQGSRPEAFDDGIFSSLDDVVQRIDRDTKKPIWRARLEKREEESLGRALSPPAVTKDRLYLTSAAGDLVVLDRASGKTLWAINVGAPILFQPAVAGGRVYFATTNGLLYAFEADDPDPNGWPMWGGGAGHNGVEGTGA